MTNDNSFKMPLYATYELLGAFGRTEVTIKEYATDIKADINIVQNTESQVALALPYYSNLEGVPSAAALSEEDLEKPSGGIIHGRGVEGLHALGRHHRGK